MPREEEYGGGAWGTGAIVTKTGGRTFSEEERRRAEFSIKEGEPSSPERSPEQARKDQIAKYLERQRKKSGQTRKPIFGPNSPKSLKKKILIRERVWQHQTAAMRQITFVLRQLGQGALGVAVLNWKMAASEAIAGQWEFEMRLWQA